MSKHIGAHVPASRTKVGEILREIRDIKADAVSIFVRPKSSRVLGKWSDKSADALAKGLPFNRKFMISHSNYSINFASKDVEKRKSAHAQLCDELTVCNQLGIATVLHPGASKDEGKAITLIANGVNRALKENPGSATILLETMTGVTRIGRTFEQLAAIIAKIDDQKRIGVCFDTCHVYLAGYDLSSPKAADATFKEFDRIVGGQYLRAVHLNGSALKQPSGNDQHARCNDALAYIPHSVFAWMMHEHRFDDMPIILERSSINVKAAAAAASAGVASVNGDGAEIAWLRNL